MATVYIETSIIGYLTARSVSDVVFQARQLLTRQWWDDQRRSYAPLVNQLVIDEVSAGDEAAAQERLEVVDGTPLLDAFQPAVDTLSVGAIVADMASYPRLRSTVENDHPLPMKFTHRMLSAWIQGT